MKVIIDRIEGDYAIVEIGVGKIVSVPRILFQNAKEGDVFKIEIDREETNIRKEKIQKLMNNLFED